MNAPAGASADRGAWKTVKRVLSYAIAAACLYWVFHDLTLGAILESLGHAQWLYLLAAIPLILLAYICIAWEWKVLLGPLGSVSLLRFCQAVLAGRFVNDVLPVHAGFVARVLLIARWTGTSVAAVVPSLAAERLLEAFWLVLGIGSLALVAPMPAGFVSTGKVLGAVTLAGTVLLVAAMFWGGRRRGSSLEPPRSRVLEQLHQVAAHFSTGFKAMAGWQLMFKAAAIGFVKLALQAVAFLILLWGYPPVSLPFTVELAVFLISYIGISIPSTPAGVGVFQVFCVAALTAFGVEKSTATAFALLAFAVMTLPLSVAGFVAFGQSGLTLFEVRRTRTDLQQCARPADALDR